MNRPVLKSSFSTNSGVVAGVKPRTQSVIEVLNALGNVDLTQVFVFAEGKGGPVTFKQNVDGQMQQIAVAARGDLARISTGLTGFFIQMKAAAALARKLSHVSLVPVESRDRVPA